MLLWYSRIWMSMLLRGETYLAGEDSWSLAGEVQEADRLSAVAECRVGSWLAEAAG